MPLFLFEPDARTSIRAFAVVAALGIFLVTR